MEWLVLVVVGVVLLGWWGGRRGTTGSGPPVMPARTTAVPAAAGGGAATVMATSPLAAEVARRALDPDDPDGAFMDGYVAGRYSERAENAIPPGARAGRGARLDDDLNEGFDEDDPDAGLGSAGDDCDTADLYSAAAWHETSDGSLHDDVSDDW